MPTFNYEGLRRSTHWAPKQNKIHKDDCLSYNITHNSPFYFYLTTLLLFLLTIYLYCHTTSNLTGKWILDDRGSVTMNPIVKAEVPFYELWNRDFWGHLSLNSTQSHKSWRPICTASYRWNYQMIGSVDDTDTYWYHVTDRLLHAIVTALSLPVAGVTFQNLILHRRDTDRPGPLAYLTFPWLWGGATLVALLYAVHPIHVEAVANTTGRAEVLCALFYFVGFLLYAKVSVGVTLTWNGSDGNIRSSSFLKCVLGVLFMTVLTWASVLCKEHGITLPIMCVVWDGYVGTNTSVPELLKYIYILRSNENTVKNTVKLHNENIQIRRKKQCQLFLLRIFYCLLITLSLGIWRLSKNGPNIPDFVCEQNPSACESNPFTRFFTYSFLWCFNSWLLFYPDWLCPDWSGDSIRLVDRWATDHRVPALVLLWGVLGWFVSTAVECVFDKNHHYSHCHSTYFHHQWKRTLVTAFFWMLLPFFLSSNALVYVGFVVADRTLYLPSFGFCLLLVQLLVWISYVGLPLLSISPPDDDKDGQSRSPTNTISSITMKYKVTTMIILSTFVLTLYTYKQQAQTKRWSDPVLLWQEAYRLNPQSCITGKEYGMSLVNANRSKDAIPVLSRIHKRELTKQWFTHTIQSVQLSWNGNLPSESQVKHANMTRLASLLQTRFKLVTAMFNGGQCINAIPLIDEGLQWTDESLLDIEVEMRKQPTKAKEDETYTTSSMHTWEELKNALQSNKSYLYVARSRCADNVAAMASFAYDAVQAQQLEFTIEHGQQVSRIVEKVQSQGLNPHNVFIEVTKGEEGEDVGYDFKVLMN